MKNPLIRTMAATLLVLGSVSGVHAAQSDQERIHAVLEGYKQALNAGDVAGILNLYTQDGVFMPQHNLSAVSIEATGAVFEAVFGAIDLEVEFDIVQIEVVADDWAFARTNSAGTTTINATGEKVAEAIRSCSCSKKPPMESGGSRAIASPPPTRRAER